MILLSGILLIVWVAGLGSTLLGSYLTLRRRKALSDPGAPLVYPPVSILKPLKGADVGLHENLESFFHLSYPEYELLFSVADPQDPAVRIIRTLVERYPLAKAQIIIGDENVGDNPKVNNLVKPYRAAQYDWILISDSNVRVPPEYVTDLFYGVGPKVGMVTSAVVGVGESTLGGALEATFLNTFYMRWMFLAKALGHPCVLGKSMLFRRSMSERFGGIKNLSHYLAEDYMAGEAMRQLGLEVLVAQEPVRQYLGRYSVRDFWLRHVRWGRIRKAQAPLAFVIEPLMSSWISGCLAMFVFSRADFPAPGILGLHMFLWFISDCLILKSTGAGLRWKTPLTWALREALSVPLWLHTALGHTVSWRGSQYRVQPGGMLTRDRHYAKA